MAFYDMGHELPRAPAPNYFWREKRGSRRLGTARNHAEAMAKARKASDKGLTIELVNTSSYEVVATFQRGVQI